jgi:hypothetical protein
MIPTSKTTPTVRYGFRKGCALRSSSSTRSPSAKRSRVVAGNHDTGLGCCVDVLASLRQHARRRVRRVWWQQRERHSMMRLGVADVQQSFVVQQRLAVLLLLEQQIAQLEVYGIVEFHLSLFVSLRPCTDRSKVLSSYKRRRKKQTTALLFRIYVPDQRLFSAIRLLCRRRVSDCRRPHRRTGNRQSVGSRDDS